MKNKVVQLSSIPSTSLLMRVNTEDSLKRTFFYEEINEQERNKFLNKGTVEYRF